MLPVPRPVPFAIVAAVLDANDGIGNAGTLPWPPFYEDIAAFRSLTLRHACIMGSRTYMSIPARMRPLSRRHNIVVTRDRAGFRERLPNEDVYVATSLAAAFCIARMVVVEPAQRTFVIGGGDIFRQVLDPAGPWRAHCTALYLTRIYEPASLPCDTFFPERENAGRGGIQFVATSDEDPHDLVRTSATVPGLRFAFLTYYPRPT